MPRRKSDRRGAIGKDKESSNILSKLFKRREKSDNHDQPNRRQRSKRQLGEVSDRPRVQKSLSARCTKRAVSPATRIRMERVLGINKGSVLSAPAVLHRRKSVSSTQSAPIPSSNRQICEITLPGKVSKKLSMDQLIQKVDPSRMPRSSRSLKLSKSRDRINSSSLEKSKAVLKKKGEVMEKSVGLETSASLSTHQLVSKRKSDTVKANVKIPKGKITVVITDIQGSTMMWEQDPSAMKDALDIHDAIIRKCYMKQSGYEITTEGDSFHLAFHHPLDALSFCLDCQTKLYNADWSEDILALENACFDRNRAMRGLRVRMGVHHGPTTSGIHEVTRRTYFKGEGLELAKALEKASHGGQIITNVTTWRAVSGMAERYLGSPQILDLGMHELKCKNGSLTTDSLVQLVPKKFAFEYFTFRGTRGPKDDIRPEGRTFAPPKTYRQVTTAFFDAPFLNNKVTIVFVHTVASKKLSEDQMSEHSKKLAALIRSLLIRTNPPGYECQEDCGAWMLAFHSVGSAIIFGLNLIDKLEIAKSPLNAKVGVHSDVFTSMGPHTVTGRADYFGPVVNRAARIAAHSKTRQVRLGIPKKELRNFDPPNIKTIKVEYLGTEVFKGVNVEMALFACSPHARRDSAENFGRKTHRRLSLVPETAEMYC